MNRLFSLVITAILAVSVSARDYHIIPQPKDIQDREGQFTLTQGMKLFAQGEANRKVATFFVTKLNRSTGLGLTLTSKKGQAQIQLLLNSKIKGEEAYRLTVSPKQVVAEASTDRGLFYAMQTFLQLLPPEVEISNATLNSQLSTLNSTWSAPCAVINDEPRFEYRSFMLDPCRHFLTIDEVKKQIDIMSMYKANNMHFHLTEDQGWRVEIKKYPLLTEVGATAIGRTNSPDGDPGKNRFFYTQEELRDLVAYAKERFINIIPEFEMPGHELAAIAAYPWLSCRDVQVKPRTTWGVEPIIMCAGKETTFQFLQDVVDELVDIFPSKYFHIGGDEAPRNEWKQCPLCQKRADELGFKDENGRSREAQLQSYIVTRMEKYLNRRGKTIIGWDEILDGGGLNKSAVVMSWLGTQGGIQAAKAGHHAIMTPSSDGYYLDYYEGDRTLEPVAPTYAARVPLSRTYSYEPVAPELEGEYEQYILGPQGNLWAEYLPDIDVAEFRLYPRILAIMETGWTPREKKDFSDFARRVDTDTYVRLEAHHAKYHIPMPEQPIASCNHVAFTDEARLTFQTSRPAPMYYTLDGSEPTIHSNRYTEPLHITANTTLKIATILPSGLKSATRTVSVQRQPLSPALPEPDSLSPGLMLYRADGLCTSVAALCQMHDLTPVALTSPEQIPRQAATDYSAIAEGLVRVPQDGVWYFLANYPSVWIDGQKVVDNTDQWVLDGHRGGRSMALAKGLHTIRIAFLGYNAGGRPTYWDNGQILWRHETADRYSKIESLLKVEELKN
ncbi:MAG: family 20 glycosylhydrolase [Bacteroidaceae bacterium]|nr:family 20 glycosylhydrolase [Bacteroidaceae bacterium]